ncbi:MAG TPA: polysaccharide biosynthesis/export family protein [Gallionellaceae bacterium]|nr:polysaccharide biosynthesis/export family protein [Gallionellaceae bacterium]
MYRFIFVALVIFFMGIRTNLSIAADKPEIYQLRQGDTVLISVWREDTLQKQVVVLPDGSVTFPLIGRVEVAGLSTPEVEQRITKKLKEYFPEPIVSVVIVGIDGNRAYVTGKVIHPGPLIISGPITVLQAISLAGGFDRFADENGIKVIRAKPAGQEIFPVNYKDIISGKNMSTNVQLKADDTLVVP